MRPNYVTAASLLSLFTLVAACTDSPTKPEALPTQIDGLSFLDFGPGNRQLELINSVVLDPEAGIDARIVQTTAQERNAIAVVFQPSTGETSYVRMPDSDGARAISNIDGDIFIGTYLKGQVFRWRPGMESPEQFELPRPDNERQEFVFSVDRGSDGFYYAGTWPEGDLMQLDLASGSVLNLGPMHDSPPREYYLRHINPSFDGSLFLSYGTESSFKKYDLATGETLEFLPDAYRDRQWVSHSVRFREMIVALVSAPSTLLFMNPETGSLIRAVDIPEGSIRPHNYRALQVHEGHLYFGVTETQNLYRYSFDDDKVELIAEGIGYPIGVAGERYLFTVTNLGLYSVVDMETNNIELQRQSDFEGDGMVVHTLAAGPETTLIGGSYINQGFFRLEPYSGALFSPGRSISHPGQIDAMVTKGNKIYIGHYIKGRFSVYDTSAPWNPGEDSTSNPRVLGSVKETQDRVPDGTLGPDGKIYFGTKPEYGKTGGSLVVLDPETNSLTVHRNIVQDQSVYAVVSDGVRYIYGTTSIRGGLGSREIAEESKLFVWDTRTQSKTLERTIVPGAYEIWGLDWVDSNTLVGAADSVLFLYDVQGDKVLTTKTAAPEEIKKIVTSQDGWIYGMTEQRLLRASKDLSVVETIDIHEGYWDSMAELTDGRLFVGRGERILELVRH